ncbi:MAG: hypothetical protein CML66_30930 [Rhodobacteraceae bacterium]|nr:hypothetical protein [Paracoccaceae bacterium]MAY46568.1 hypothetical protein [Paracoccaceae bacterium]
MRYRVIEGWTATYPTAIAVRRGDPVTLDGRRDDWEGHLWVWAQARDGCEGWIPDDCVADGQATRDFDAMELTCGAGAILEGIEQTHGWVLCRASDGRSGWVPSNTLVALSD